MRSKLLSVNERVRERVVYRDATHLKILTFEERFGHNAGINYILQQKKLIAQVIKRRWRLK